jgi:tetratricopeptide (TPR) repeat protein
MNYPNLKNEENCYILDCGVGKLSALSSAFEMCRQLFHLTSADSYDLERLIADIVGAFPKQHSGVTYALERRVSRENIMLARNIERLAKFTLALLKRYDETAVFVVPDASNADDITLKFLARVIPFSVQRWDLYSAATIPQERQKLYDRLGVTTDCPVRLLNTQPSKDSFNDEVNLNLGSLQQQLVLTNYGTCLNMVSFFQENRTISDSERSEGFRILGIAALNRGLFDQSLKYFSEAERLSRDRFKKAHIACLQSLVCQKRLYDPLATKRHITRGLTYLTGKKLTPVDQERRHLEHAWLLNSDALSSALTYRKTKSASCWTRAMSLVQEAFALACKEDSHASSYLRYNLAANSIFLLEMRGDFKSALLMLDQCFASMSSAAESEDSMPESFVYRRAILVAKSGEPEEALHMLDTLVPNYLSKNAWFLAERVLRASAKIASQLGRHSAALDYASLGIQICTREKSGSGEAFHRTLLDSISTATKSAEKALVGISPKLPSYIPEIDLEEVPKIDLNQYLSTK